ncbi:lipocalin family protein [Flavobacterium sp. SM2513]|uniref:lipocalin family protein n=1 Tax=Flavobacterium sp. SM2513 TaxID=3424766 RepID=UPI003D7FD02A
MKNLVLSLFTTLLFVSCQEKKAETFDVNLLNGYWEIEHVTMADGSQKDYKMSETIDYFEVKQDSGFRKKVNPQVDGTYLVNDSEEKIKIEKSREGTYISYKTEFATWNEKIKTLTKEQLVLENEQHIQYQYKKPTSFTVK